MAAIHGPSVGNAAPGVPLGRVRILEQSGEYGRGYGLAVDGLKVPDWYRRNAGVGVPYNGTYRE